MEQLLGGVQDRKSFSDTDSLSYLCFYLLSLFVSPNLPQTRKHFLCWCYLENGSSVDCCVHQSIMNINEEPPHQQSYIIHQLVDMFVNSSGFFLPLY